MEAHHLWSVKSNPSLSLSLFNGIVLDRNLHLEFHRLYGSDTKIEHFLLYLELLGRQKRLGSATDIQVLMTWVRLLEKNLGEGGFRDG